ncbi:hypothetical protein VPNG_05123 [Cytospora leucostoma]|uniref:Cytochrome P450 n=1 Tax=Cytospora leucostoma TaxID=1230097 RepID=A0A423X4L8_9PEZI|nr:hypothetical protein VPNG_05123 [Cytospora leucostoma]
MGPYGVSHWAKSNRIIVGPESLVIVSSPSPQSQEEFSLQDLATDFSFDVIGTLVLDVDMGAQTKNPAKSIRVFRELIETYTREQIDLPWWVIVREKFAETQQEIGTHGHSILSMSLQNLESLSEHAIEATCDQLSTFIFAGHDKDADKLVYNMPHTSAVLKETLRLWPPGATARMTQPGDGLQLTMESGGLDRVLNVDGIMLRPLQQAIHRDPAVFGDNANAFVPERWLGLGAEKVPAGAWRPFERGPRNCIGQELAMIQARVVIAMVARRLDFVKVGIGALTLDSATGKPILGKNGQHKVTEELYQVRPPYQLVFQCCLVYEFE